MRRTGRTSERSWAAPWRLCVWDLKMDPLPLRWARITRPICERPRPPSRSAQLQRPCQAFLEASRS